MLIHPFLCHGQDVRRFLMNAGCNFDIKSLKKQDMAFFRQLAEYLYIKKRDPNAPRNINIKLMHGMNRISLLIFVAALLFMLVKFVILPLFR